MWPPVQHSLGLRLTVLGRSLMEDWDDCVAPAAKTKRKSEQPSKQVNAAGKKTAGVTETAAKATASKRKLQQSILSDAEAAQSDAKSCAPKAKAGKKQCEEGVAAKLPKGQSAKTAGLQSEKSQDENHKDLQIPSQGFFVPITQKPILVASVCTGQPKLNPWPDSMCLIVRSSLAILIRLCKFSWKATCPWTDFTPTCMTRPFSRQATQTYL